FSSRRRHTRFSRDWSSDVCSSDLMGLGYHRESEKRLHQVTVDNNGEAPVVSSAGALVDGLHAMGAKKVSILTPYMKPLTQLVVRSEERRVGNESRYRRLPERMKDK